MPVGWIDFSSEHRERTRSAIAALSAPGAVDELGIGIIRDAFADTLFPGISTIQTRPKYFLLTLKLIDQYRRLTPHTQKRKSLEQFLEEQELEDRIQLVQAHPDSNDIGIIGGTFQTRRDRNVQRRPSSIYWNGLCKFGMVRPSQLSLAEFGRRLGNPNLNSLLMEATANDKGDDVDALDHTRDLFIDPPPEKELPREQLAIQLTTAEAVYLRDKIVQKQGNQFLGQLLASPQAVEQILQLPAPRKFEDLVALPCMTQLDDTTHQIVQHALKFWQLLRGAHIRYNCMLQTRFGTPAQEAEFQKEWDAWKAELGDYLNGWEMLSVWSLLEQQKRRVRPQTRAFIEAWIKECQNGCQNTERCESLVRQQEISNKGSRARLSKQQDSINDWVGLSAVEYRFPQVFTLIQDIHQATEGAHA